MIMRVSFRSLSSPNLSQIRKFSQIRIDCNAKKDFFLIIRAMEKKDLTGASQVHKLAFVRQRHSPQWLEYTFSASTRTLCYISERDGEVEGLKLFLICTPPYCLSLAITDSMIGSYTALYTAILIYMLLGKTTGFESLSWQSCHLLSYPPKHLKISSHIHSPYLYSEKQNKRPVAITGTENHN